MRRVFVWIAVVASACACCITHADDSKAPVRHVVLVSIDGLAASYLNDPRAQLPTLRRLMQEGASAEGMLTSFPSVTWPSHTSLVTGVEPGRHGVIGNSVWDAKRNRGLTYIGDPELTKERIDSRADALRRGPSGRPHLRQRHLALLQRRESR